MNDKISFITDLLNSKKITVEEKTRVLDLTKGEFSYIDSENSEIKKRINEIEKTLKSLKLNKRAIQHSKINNDHQVAELNESPGETSVKKSYPIYYIKNQNQSKFLNALNNNTFTKFLTHDFDSNDFEDLKIYFDGKYDFILHLEKIKQVFNVLTESESPFKENYPELNKVVISQNLFKKINNYINGYGSWGEENNSMNWSDPNLLNWSNENIGKAPAPANDLGYEGFIFGDKTFYDIVTNFNNEIHLRKTNSLDLILKKVLFEPSNNFKNKLKIEKSINESIDLFIDIEKLKQLIRLIFNLIVEKHQQDSKPEVHLAFYSNDKRIELLILHNNSIYGHDKNTLRFGKTLKNIMKLSNGLCDIEIEAELSDGKCYSLPIWTKGRKIENDIVFQNDKEVLPSESISELNRKINGVLYKITFDI